MSKLKTVWDAVNELRGNLNNTPNFSGGEMYLFHFVNHDRIGSSYGKHGLDGVINHICTVDEFNALVEDMTLGLDVNPVNHGHYLNYVNADKAPLEKETKPDYTSLEFWKDAPEGYNAFMPEGENWHDSLFSLLDGKPKLMMRAEGKIEYNAGCYHVDALMSDGLILRTINKQSVYTQEMADSGVLPSVGMKCIAESNGVVGGSYLVTVSQINDKGQFACIDENGDYLIHYPDEDKSESFKPIDTRTKKEKAIDEIFNNRVWDNSIELLGLAYDEWVGD